MAPGAPAERSIEPSVLRRIAIARQGLTSAGAFGEGREGVRLAIEHLGYVQIDTIAVIERAHHQILWSRVPGYSPEDLGALMAAGTIFEYWHHAASYLPVRDFRFALPRMNAIRRGANRYYANVDKRLMKAILERVRSDGPIRARDLEKDSGRAGKWWNWSASKRALDRLFMQGDLMVRGRAGMEKTFDLAERILPPGIGLSEPSQDEYADYLADGAIKAHGFVTWKQVSHLRTGAGLRKALSRSLDERVADGRLVRAADGFAEPEALEKASSPLDASVRLLSPFDNLVIHRERLHGLFGLDYRLECYVPQPKRRFGYFCLPILFGEGFAGLADCKADRKHKRLQVVGLHVVAPSVDPDALAPPLAAELDRLAAFNGCDGVDLPGRASSLRSALAKALPAA